MLGEEERLQASVDRVTASLLASPLSSSAGESSCDKFLVMWEFEKTVIKSPKEN